MSGIDLLYLFFISIYIFFLVGGGEGCPFTAKYKLKKKIQIKVVYDCAEITKKSSSARIKMGKNLMKD